MSYTSNCSDQRGLSGITSSCGNEASDTKLGTLRRTQIFNDTDSQTGDKIFPLIISSITAFPKSTNLLHVLLQVLQYILKNLIQQYDKI